MGRLVLLVLLLLYACYGLAGLGVLIYGIVIGNWEVVGVGLVLVISYGLFFLGGIGPIRDLLRLRR